jgi:murein DD-endopeptidase MepM/ murein hydrolase activator NlpD
MLFIVCCAAVFAFAAPVGAAGEGIVVVQQGQTLGAIAAQHKVSVAQICQWNNLSSPDKVRVGQQLYVRPPERASAPTAAASRTPSAKQAKSAPQAPPKATLAPADGIPEKVKLELANVGKTLVNNAAKTIMPNVKAKAVAPGDSGGYVASYMAVDTTDIRTEVIPSAEPGKYVGSIRYVENQYECPGKSKADALQAECQVVRSRRINELIRYEKGKWHH